MTQSSTPQESAGGESGSSESGSSESGSSESRTGVARLFDVRLVIGGLLTLYGIVLTIKGITDNHAALQKAAGYRINLWTGLGLLVVGLFFLAWMKFAPLQAVKPDEAYEVPAEERR
jgi:xanthine/uracil/vitamin C permease (AzgA family)